MNELNQSSDAKNEEESADVQANKTCTGVAVASLASVETNEDLEKESTKFPTKSVNKLIKALTVKHEGAKKLSLIKVNRAPIMRLRKSSNISRGTQKAKNIESKTLCKLVPHIILKSNKQKFFAKQICAVKNASKLPPIHPNGHAKVSKEKPKKYVTLKHVTRSPMRMSIKLDYSKSSINNRLVS